MDLDAQAVLYEDEWLLAVAKPPGLPVHATRDAKRDTLEAALGRWLRDRDGVPGYLTLQHRLDLDTSGVVVFARKPEANAALARAFADRAAQKTYLALTLRPDALPAAASVVAGATWVVRNHLADKKKHVPPVVAVRAGGDAARTDFVLIAVAAHALLVQARPHTGRRHQIRVHLADARMPIWGDRDYGPPDAQRAPRLMLHAWELQLPHPRSGEVCRLRCPLPQDFRDTAQRHGLALPETRCD